MFIPRLHSFYASRLLGRRAWGLLVFMTMLTLCHLILPSSITPIPLKAADCATSLRDLSSAMGTYNLITLDDLSTTSDVEGRTFVGGNYVSGNSATLSMRLGKVPSSENTVEIVGNLSSGNPINVNGGSLRLGGQRNNRMINFNGGGRLNTDATLSATTLTASLQTGSLALAQLAANNNMTIPVGQPGPLRFTVTNVTSAGFATFWVNANDIFNNPLVQQIELAPQNATTIVINVAGTTVNWNYGNKVGNFVNKNWRGNVIWNFYEATTINLNSRNFMGALLAPLATVKASGNIDGAVAVGALATTSEVHQPEFFGNLDNACSTPTATPTLTATPTAIPTHTPTPTVIPTSTAIPTATPLPVADLTVIKYSSPNPVVAGLPLRYTIVVTNHGPRRAENVTVTDTLPAGVTFRSASADCTEQATVITCALGTLPTGWQSVITIEVDVKATSADLN